MPLGRWLVAATSMCAMGRAACEGAMAAALTVRVMPVGAAASTTVPHCWHSAQRPTHLAVLHPHSVQRKAVLVRAMPRA
ncbi:hypothetical protein GCM10010196_03860 [Agromyces mediolanus]|uniref:Secreted protein n=1 Tax=Agromyces mediolanus TaxID=41986 RepID=A0A918CCW3_AGRME|nr:hypothetical protein GCM10010196_03860 [Agromyces mediolanus]